MYDYRLLANLVIVVHFAFILFALFGVFLTLWEKRWAWFHVPVVIWAVLIEWIGWVCPLTPLENWLRHKSGQAGYQGSFIEQYIYPLLYPLGLTRSLQFLLGAIVMSLNLAIYGWILYRKRKHLSA
jgi:hypothetical protein